MVTTSKFSVVVIGGGPAGIAAATAAAHDGASTLLIDQNRQLGGRLNQSIHNGFGFVRFENAFTGPEYAFKEISVLNQTNCVVLLQTAVTDIVSIGNTFQLTLSNRHGIVIVDAKSIVIAAGAREITPRELYIHGSRPSGLFTAGAAQYYMNVLGQLPCRACVVLGSSNLALIAARRLAIEGVKVLGAYEPTGAVQGYLDYASLCLFDNDIPLHFNHTVLRVIGRERLRAVVLARTDSSGAPIRGSENVIKCDGLIVSRGLVADSRLALSLKVPFSRLTNEPVCDQNMMTMIDGVFSGGNACHISDLVDYVSESGEIAGRGAARYVSRTRHLISIDVGKDFLSVAPQLIDYEILYGDTVLFFTPSVQRDDCTVRVLADNEEVFSQKYDSLRARETQRISFRLPPSLSAQSVISLTMS
ncbi:MAG: NAD(P)/FAD-dependent oxidoreductase [Oscillospiraceae bacterium]|nr:NAD(P)/FAD-dependent oxidoreductase [Oscillospiraceae bacterium]